MRGTSNKASMSYKRDVAGVLLSLAPPNPPSPPNGVGFDGYVKFVWTESPSTFPGGYDMTYTREGDETTYMLIGVHSPVYIAADDGVEVCARLRGKAHGVESGWSFEGCATSTGAELLLGESFKMGFNSTLYTNEPVQIFSDTEGFMLDMDFIPHDYYYTGGSIAQVGTKYQAGSINVTMDSLGKVQCEYEDGLGNGAAVKHPTPLLLDKRNTLKFEFVVTEPGTGFARVTLNGVAESGTAHGFTPVTTDETPGLGLPTSPATNSHQTSYYSAQLRTPGKTIKFNPGLFAFPEGHDINDGDILTDFDGVEWIVSGDDVTFNPQSTREE